jgi:SAM-dependent methyltransferase
MKTLKEQFIVEVVRVAVGRAAAGRRVRVLDLGCGTASYVPALVEQYPSIEYVGVEPIATSYAVAEKNLAGIENAKIHFKLGYDSVPDEVEASFDVVFSLSALEHIKQLGRFIALSAKYATQGGMVVHRYDLGHALQPHSLKERLHVILGNTVPSLLPERQFVRYVGVPEVESYYQASGLTPIRTTYHQMPSHKAIEKHFKLSTSSIVDDIFAWEMKYQNDILTIPVPAREKLFPAIAVWGEKV